MEKNKSLRRKPYVYFVTRKFGGDNDIFFYFFFCRPSTKL